MHGYFTWWYYGVSVCVNVCFNTFLKRNRLMSFKNVAYVVLAYWLSKTESIILNICKFSIHVPLIRKNNNYPRDYIVNVYFLNNFFNFLNPELKFIQKNEYQPSTSYAIPERDHSNPRRSHTCIPQWNTNNIHFRGMDCGSAMVNRPQKPNSKINFNPICP